MWLESFEGQNFQGLATLKFFKPGARRPARAWFLNIDMVRTSVCVCVCVCVRVCPPPGLLKTIHVKGSLNNQPNKSYCLSVSLYGTCYRYC